MQRVESEKKEKQQESEQLDWLEIRNWTEKYLDEKWLNTDMKMAYRKILRSTKKAWIRNQAVFE